MSRRRVARYAMFWTARIVTAAGLAIDAYVHLHLAPLYAEGGGTINESVLFRAEAVVALLGRSRSSPPAAVSATWPHSRSWPAPWP